TGNLISGNLGHGIWIEGASARHNGVQGNYIGTNAAGTAPLGNAVNGVFIQDAPNNTIGGPGIAGNLISANGFVGVWIEGEAAARNRVENNRIGTDANGDDALMGNLYGGVYVYLASNNQIVSNQIRYNARHGVTVYGGYGNTISRNSISSNA